MLSAGEPQITTTAQPGSLLYLRAAGINTNDWAESDYRNAGQSGEIDEEIDVFTGTDAQKAMTTLWQEFGKCSSFSYPSNGTTASNTLTRSQLPGEGDGAIKAVIVSPLFEGGDRRGHPGRLGDHHSAGHIIRQGLGIASRRLRRADRTAPAGRQLALAPPSKTTRKPRNLG